MRRAISPSSILISGLFPEPGIQFYQGNFLDGLQKRLGSMPDNFRFGLASEAQHYQDSPQQPDFLTTLLKKGEKWTQSTILKLETT